MGRRPSWYDKGITLAYRTWRHLVNPRDAMERVLRGPIFRRTLD
jgi:hypothetical protein